MSTIKTVFSLFDSEDPDVLITTPYQQFTLHSKMLKLCSRWFAASMSKEWWTGAAVDGDTISYRYVLNFDKDAVSTLLPEHQPVSKTFDTPPPLPLHVRCPTDQTNVLSQVSSWKYP